MREVNDRPFVRYLVLLALLLHCVSGCAGHSPVDDTGPAPETAHPLVEKIWASGKAAFVDPGQLNAALARADYLLLGEVHDNVHHHELQAQLVARFAGPPQSVAVGFEQLDRSQAPALERYLSEHPGDADGLGAAVDWSGSGWPDWSLYEPVFQQVLDKGWQPVPLMFAGEQSRRILEQGYSAVLDEGALALLQPENALSDSQKSEVETLMRYSHCGKLPEEYLARMVTIQTAKDAYMAWAQVESGPRGILIVGDGHARKDRGIPLFLRTLKPEADIVVVSMVEVEPGAASPVDYPQVQPSYSDYVIFTERQQRDDPCAALAF
ncbi:MAG: ChaN family lipoprotein [Halieaceae bacterium]|jgi:uncharacterized iron-regulated protein|nr:ChaN family lipoprotein [Halieaceae bacterium]